MRGLGFILFLFIFTKQSESACRILPRTGQFNGCPVSVNGVNVVILVNSTVEIMQPTCERCDCGNTGASCCSLYGTPTSFPDDCKLIYVGCQPFVVKKNDSTVLCPVFGIVG